MKAGATATQGPHRWPNRPKLRGSRGAASPPRKCRFPARPVRAGGSVSGAVTAEFAVALPAVTLLLALLLAGSAAGVTQLRFEEAARAGARALARGESAGSVEGIVRRLAGESAGLLVVSDGEWLSVTVSGRVPGSVGSLVPWTLTARAWARSESAQASVLVRTGTAYEHQPVRIGG